MPSPTDPTTRLMCPMPGELNPLYLNGYKFNIIKFPNVSYWVQQVGLPTISLGMANLGTPLSEMKFPGDHIDYSDLQISFLVDAGLDNYGSLFLWMVSLGYPMKHEQYKHFLNLYGNKAVKDYPADIERSDAVLTILDAAGRPKKSFQFVNLFPLTLSGFEFDATTAEAEPAKATASFAYDYFYPIQ